MSRLTHDFPSSLRACQMSRSEFFCFVEGVDNDRYVYSQFASPIFKKNKLAVEYQTANLLSSAGQQGGKEPLIKFFNYLSSLGLLSQDFKGKKTTFAFFLDKDVDELQKCHVISRYVFYTKHYDLQNYLFLHGDVINSAAACASIPAENILLKLGDQHAWLNQCAEMWQEWVTICLFLKVNKISLGGYGVSSKINTKEYGATDQVLLDKYKALALKKSGLDQEAFDACYEDAATAVGGMYATGNANKVFKGKWYLDWLENHLLSQHRVRVSRKNLACTLSAHLDWNGDWTDPYKAKLIRLIKEHAMMKRISGSALK